MSSESNTPDAVSVRFGFTPSDAVRANRLARPRDGLRWAGPAAFTVFALLWIASLARSGEIAGAVVVAALVGFGYAAWYAYPHWLERRVGDQYPELFRGDIVTTLDESGLRSEQGGVVGHRPWSAISDFAQDENHIVVRQGRMVVAVVPKRSFANTAERDHFLETLASHVRESGKAVSRGTA